MADDLTLTVGGRALTGWEDLAVSRSCEALPNSFVLRASQPTNAPGSSPGPISSLAAGIAGFLGGQAGAPPAAALVNEGDACTISLGSDLVVTGYVDQTAAGYDASNHWVEVQGRGKCQDLVDCSAEWKGFQISGTDALDIAQKLTAPYGLTAKVIGDKGPAIPQFNINLGDTPASVLELITRFAALLYYEGTDGNLVLARVGSAQHASGFAEGVNVQAASFLRSASSRYSVYKVTNIGIDTSGIIQNSDGLFIGVSRDANVKRNRKLYIVDGGVEGASPQFLQNRADWEAARRYGRSRAVRLTCDSWRDKAGKLWTPNTLVPVSLPRLSLAAATMVIADVTYRAAKGSGKTAELTLMPPAAFLPEPVLLQPLIPELAGAVPFTQSLDRALPNIPNFGGG